MNHCATPVAPTERLASIDVVRGVALFGVMAINLLSEFRESIFRQFLPHSSPGNSADRLTLLFAQNGLTMKAFSLFSFLFGVGLAIQYERVSQRGAPVQWLARRLAVLLVLGLIHLLFIWNGDILTEYAVAGFVVLPFLAGPRWVLGTAAAAWLVFFAMMPLLDLPLSIPDESWLRQHVALADIAYGRSGFIAEHRFALAEVRDLIALHLMVLPRTIGLFLLGVLAWRAELFKNPVAHCGSIALLALVLVILGASLTHADGRMTSQVAPAVLALGYCASLVWLVEFTPLNAVLRAFAPLGRMAFSNYILESLLFSVLFFGYGLGLYGTIGPAATLLLGTLIYGGQMILSAWWLALFRFGPLEWLWRTLMYGRRQPMRRVAGSSALGQESLAP